MLDVLPDSPQIVLPGGGVLEAVVILPELVVVRPQPVYLPLAVVVGVDEPHDRVLQLGVEGVAGVVRRVQVVVHGGGCVGVCGGLLC